jgi:hypothetical protein
LKLLGVTAPQEESEGSQSYYSASSDEDMEDLKEACKILLACCEVLEVKGDAPISHA